MTDAYRSMILSSLHPFMGYDRGIIHSLLVSNDIFCNSILYTVKHNEPFEIPTYVDLERCENWDISDTKARDIVTNSKNIVRSFPLYYRGCEESRCTIQSAIKGTFDKTAIVSGVKKVNITGKNPNTYYGGSGLILDKNMNPLVMLTSVYNIIETQTINALGDKASSYQVRGTNKYIFHVNPVLFSDTKSPLSRTIINDFIPVYLEESKGGVTEIKISIDEMGGFFLHNKVPSEVAKEDFNKVFSDKLLENTDLVSSLFLSFT